MWVPLGLTEWSCILGASLTASIALLFSVQLMRMGSVGFVQPFRYTLILWASLFGFLAFAEVPDAPTIIGSLILVAAGSSNVRLEQARGKTADALAAAQPTAAELRPSPRLRRRPVHP